MTRPRNGKQSGRRWHQIATRFRTRCQANRYPCHICGQPIDYTKRKPHPEAFEADHRYPVSTHPHLMWDEALLLPSHARCNNSRDNQPLETGRWTPADW